MPQTTGAKYAASSLQGGDAGNVWTNEQLAREADEPDEAQFATVQVGSLTTTTKSQRYGGFALLAEDGGTIPAGATITRVLFEFRLRVRNSTGGLDNFVARLWGMAQRAGATVGTSEVVQPAARTSSGFLDRTVDFPGTIASPQTTFSRADLASGQVHAAIDGEKVSGATGNADLDCAWVRASAEWVLYLDADGGGKNTVKASGTATAIVEAPGGGKTDAESGAGQTVVITKSGGGVSSPCKAGGAAKPLVSTAGGAATAATAGDGGSTVLATPDGGGKADADAGAGTSTVTSYAISGEARSGADDSVIPDVRVDVYRTSDHEHMGQDTTDAAGEYAVAVPLTGNEAETFWARFYKAGAPNQFATTDEDLELIETTVQEA